MKKLLFSFLFRHRMNFRSFLSSMKHQFCSVKISRVAAIQINFRTFKNAGDFHKYVLGIVKKAKDKGAQLVCFPQGMNLEIKPIPLKLMDEAQKRKLLEVYANVFKDIASREKVYIEESTVMDGKFEGSVWTPDGERLSDKMIECDNKKMSFLQFDSDFEVVEDDAELYFFPRFGYNVKRGTEISKAWLLAQQNYVFSVESKLVGEYFNTKLRGKSGVYAPLEITEFKDGILAISDTQDEEEIVVADLDFEALEELNASLETENYEQLLF
jgi:hypothetical protein